MDIIDLRDTIQPFALLKIADCLKRLGPGCMVEFVGLDRTGLEDLRRILPAPVHDIRPMSICGGEGPFIVRITKTI